MMSWTDWRWLMFPVGLALLIFVIVVLGVTWLLIAL